MDTVANHHLRLQRLVQPPSQRSSAIVCFVGANGKPTTTVFEGGLLYVPLAKDAVVHDIENGEGDETHLNPEISKICDAQGLAPGKPADMLLTLSPGGQALLATFASPFISAAGMALLPYDAQQVPISAVPGLEDMIVDMITRTGVLNWVREILDAPNLDAREFVQGDLLLNVRYCQGDPHKYSVFGHGGKLEWMVNVVASFWRPEREEDAPSGNQRFFTPESQVYLPLTDSMVHSIKKHFDKIIDAACNGSGLADTAHWIGPRGPAIFKRIIDTFANEAAHAERMRAFAETVGVPAENVIVA